MTLIERMTAMGGRTYIVAEMSANHGGDIDVALRTVEAARTAGADAIKIQTYTPDTMTIRSARAEFSVGKGTLWQGRELYDLYREASMPWAWHRPLMQKAEDVGLDFFSTAFDPSSVEFLEDLGVRVHKVSSFEVVDLPLIRQIGSTRKPVIISTGMSTTEEIVEAVETARSSGAQEVILLKCTSAYPSPPQDMHLRTIPDMRVRFGTPVGLSDHSLGHAVPVTAVALGACMLEKHFTLSKELGGPDAEFSMEAGDFTDMVDAVRMAERALGSAHYGPTPNEVPSMVFRRSLFAVEDIPQGKPFSTHNVRAIRPGYGLPPKDLDRLLGHRANSDIERGTPLSWDLVECESL